MQRSNSPRNRTSSSMNRNDSRRRNNFSNNGRNFNRGTSRPREEHPAVCDKCKKDCTLPFKPTEGKPVLCKDCFQKAGGNSSPRPRSSFKKTQSNFGRTKREEHKATCDKCKKDCTVPFKPTPGKPVLCKDCFQKN